MLFTQAAKLEPGFCSDDYRPFFGRTKTPILQILSLPNSMNGATSVSFKQINGTC
jgi:hypothetical protein